MRVGITGHQNLPDGSGIEWLRRGLISEVKDFKGSIYAYSSLSKGADQLFAKVVLNFGIELIAVIPCEHYEQTFGAKDRCVFYDLLNKCNSVIRLPFLSPTEAAFMDAGKYITDHSDIIIAIWDGQNARGYGGTADIVNYAISLEKPVIQLNPITYFRTVLSKTNI
jgi:hypothetical protein